MADSGIENVGQIGRQHIQTLAWNHGDPNAVHNLNAAYNTAFEVSAGQEAIDAAYKGGTKEHPRPIGPPGTIKKHLATAKVHQNAAMEHDARGSAAKSTARKTITLEPSNLRGNAEFN